MNDINKELPDKGKDIIGITDDGKKVYCFRCNCNNNNCIEWRCSVTGAGLLISIVKWDYYN